MSLAVAATVLSLLVLIAFLLSAFFAFDQLIRIEYEQHRDAWESDGKPVGFFWRAKECSLVGSGGARMWLTVYWLFQTPTWVATSPALQRKLRRLRLSLLVWNAGFITWFFVVRSFADVLRN